MNPPMAYSKNGLELTKSFEACVLEAYPDPGTKGAPWTIGWGHTGGVKAGDVCDRDQADAWLLEDVRKAVDAVNRYVTVQVTQEEFDALADFTFNCGVSNFVTSTLLRLLNSGDVAGAAHQFKRWDMAAGKHMAGLLRRRLAEEAEFNGNAQPG